jgi:hypothetical protein
LIVFLVIGGAVSDRFPRQRVLIAANLGSGVTQGCVAALLLSGHYSLPAVAILELANGTLTAFTMPALRAVIVDLLERDQLRRANSLLGIMRNSAKIAGPAVSGLLVSTVGGGTSITIDAVTYVIAAFAMSRMRNYPNNSGDAARSPLLDDIRAGWIAFRSVPWAWPVAVSYCVVNIVQACSWQVLGPALTKQIAGEKIWGIQLSVRGIGLVLASVLLYRLAVRHLLRVGQSAGILGAIPLIVLGLHASIPVLMISALVAGIGASAASLAWETSLQEHIPGPVLSRVSSFDQLLSYAAIPLGMLSISPLVGVAGGFTIVLVAGLIYTAAVAAPLAVPAVRNLPHGATEFTPR